MLRLIEGAIERGCRDCYDSRQRRAVYLGYASNMFVDAIGPFQTLVAEIGGQLAAVAQVDVDGGQLRALFVDAALQGQGVGRALLAAAETRARAAGCSEPSRRDVAATPCPSMRTRATGLPAGRRGCSVPVVFRVPVTWMEKALRG